MDDDFADCFDDIDDLIELTQDYERVTAGLIFRVLAWFWCLW